MEDALDSGFALTLRTLKAMCQERHGLAVEPTLKHWVEVGRVTEVKKNLFKKAG